MTDADGPSPMRLATVAVLLAAGAIVAASLARSPAVVVLALAGVALEIGWVMLVRTGRASTVSGTLAALLVASIGVNALLAEFPGARSDGLVPSMLLGSSSLVLSWAVSVGRLDGVAADWRSRLTGQTRLALLAIPALVLLEWRFVLVGGDLAGWITGFLVGTAILGAAVVLAVDAVSLPAIPAGLAALAAFNLMDPIPSARYSAPARVVVALLVFLPLILLPMLVGWAEAMARGRASQQLSAMVLFLTVAGAAASGAGPIVLAGIVLVILVGRQRLGDRLGAVILASARMPWVWALYGWSWAAVALLIRGYWRFPGMGLLQASEQPLKGLASTLPALLALLVFTIEDVQVVRTPGRAVEARWPRWMLVAMTVLIVGVAGVGIARQWSGNHDPEVTDQGAYVGYAEGLRDQPGGIAVDRNRMPLYPYALSLVLPSGASRQEGLEVGKAVGVVIAVIGSAVVGWWLNRRIGVLGAAAGMSVLLLSVVMFKAPFAQADLAVLFLLLASAVACWRVLRAPTAMRGAIAGTVLGVTQLTKANAAIMLLVLLGVGTVAAMVPRRWSGLTPSARRAMPVALVSVVGLFLVVLAPYLANSNRAYGDPFFNANSTYYFWYDSWPEAKAGLQAHESPTPGSPEPEPVPSWGRYLDDHTPGDVVDRLVDGFVVQYKRTSRAYGFLDFGALALLAAVAAFGVAPRRLAPRFRASLAFGVITVAGYLTFTAWWMKLVQGERFVLLMFMPTLVISLIAVERFGRRRWVVWRGRTVTVATLLFSGLTLVVLLSIPALVLAVWSVGGGE